MIALDLATGVLATAALLLPGWMAARKAQLPQPVVAGLIAGAVVLHGIVIAFDALHVPLTRSTIGAAWITLIAAAWVWRRKSSAVVPAGAFAPFVRNNWPLLLPLIPASVVVTWRAITQPLYGLDTIFRWNWLAEQMLARGNLAFYPPVSAADFEAYGWPDGIAPVVSALYFWCYAVAGEARPMLTAPMVLLQFAAVMMLTAALARRWFSDRAAAFAVALLACSPVVLWATTMGQETGLTALSLAAMLLWLPSERAAETTPALIAAGMAAALGALAREYGLVWIALGLGMAAVRRLSPRALLIFGVTAGLGALPWYLRNWAITGNPLFNLQLGGLFPINRVHAWLMECYADEFGLRNLPPNAAWLLVTNCLAGLAAGFAGALFAPRHRRVLLVATAAVTLLWLFSLRYTAAGFVNSLRVLNPALVCVALLGGAACARGVPGRRHLTGASIALGVFAIDSALRALVLPAIVYRYDPRSWPTVGGAVHEYHAHPVFAEFARVTSGHRVLVLGPDALLTRHGARTVPLWSPEVAFLFDASLSRAEITRRLAAAGIGFALLKKAAVNECFLERSPYLSARRETLQLLWADEEHELFRVTVMPKP